MHWGQGPPYVTFKLNSYGCREELVAIDTCVGRFSEPADASAALDCARVTPLERWDVDASSPAVSHRPGSRFGRQGACDKKAISDGYAWTNSMSRWCCVHQNCRHGLTLLVPAPYARFMNGVEDFDAACFGIQPSEALVLDPQQRLMLQVALLLSIACVTYPYFHACFCTAYAHFA